MAVSRPCAIFLSVLIRTYPYPSSLRRGKPFALPAQSPFFLLKKNSSGLVKMRGMYYSMQCVYHGFFNGLFRLKYEGF